MAAVSAAPVKATPATVTVETAYPALGVSVKTWLLPDTTETVPLGLIVPLLP